MLAISISQGDKFSRFTVSKEIEKSRSHRRFECSCECGNTRIVFMSALRSGLSKSCGCLRDEIVTKHGKSKTEEYGIWTHIISRCENRKSKSWKNYGGRGIKVCDKWRRSFEAFLADVGQRPSSLHSIDRYPDNNGNYEPGNTRWATMSQQLRNNRRTNWVLCDGESLPLIEVAEKIGIHPKSLAGRLKRGSPLSAGVSRPFKSLQRFGGAPIDPEPFELGQAPFNGEDL